MLLIDPPLWPGRRGRAVGRVFSHLVSDASFEELHAFAALLNMPPRAFERDHYDVPGELYDEAVRLGAAPVGCQELVRRLTASGLRRPKHPRPEHPHNAHRSTEHLDPESSRRHPAAG